jgi:hypothetical protein
MLLTPMTGSAPAVCGGDGETLPLDVIAARTADQPAPRRRPRGRRRSGRPSSARREGFAGWFVGDVA